MGGRLAGRRAVQDVRAQYNYSALKPLPTISTGQAEDLKVETELDGVLVRIWLSRCGVLDGEPWEHPVSAEVCCSGRWEEVLRWNGDNPLECYDPRGGFSVRKGVWSR